MQTILGVLWSEPFRHFVPRSPLPETKLRVDISLAPYGSPFISSFDM